MDDIDHGSQPESTKTTETAHVAWLSLQLVAWQPMESSYGTSFFQVGYSFFIMVSCILNKVLMMLDQLLVKNHDHSPKKNCLSGRFFIIVPPSGAISSSSRSSLPLPPLPAVSRGFRSCSCSSVKTSFTRREKEAWTTQRTGRTPRCHGMPWHDMGAVDSPGSTSK